MIQSISMPSNKQMLQKGTHESAAAERLDPWKRLRRQQVLSPMVKEIFFKRIIQLAGI